MGVNTVVFDTAHLSIFIGGNDDNFYISEKLLELVPMKDKTTKGWDIHREVKNIFEIYNLNPILFRYLSWWRARHHAKYLATDCKVIFSFHCILRHSEETFNTRFKSIHKLRGHSIRETTDRRKDERSWTIQREAQYETNEIS